MPTIQWGSKSKHKQDASITTCQVCVVLHVGYIYVLSLAGWARLDTTLNLSCHDQGLHVGHKRECHSPIASLPFGSSRKTFNKGMGVWQRLLCHNQTSTSMSSSHRQDATRLEMCHGHPPLVFALPLAF